MFATNNALVCESPEDANKVRHIFISNDFLKPNNISEFAIDGKKIVSWKRFCKVYCLIVLNVNWKFAFTFLVAFDIGTNNYIQFTVIGKEGLKSLEYLVKSFPKYLGYTFPL